MKPHLHPPAPAVLKTYRSDHDQGSGSLDAAAGRITPLSHWDARWLWFSLRHGKLGGTTPTYRIAKANRHAAPVANENLGVWAAAADTETWHKFDNQSVGADDISLSNAAPFPAGKIYIAHLPMYPFSRVARKLAEWLAHAYVSDAAGETHGVIGYATPRDAGDGSGRMIPALPYYGFKVTRPGPNPKNKAILAAYVHPNETQGPWQLEGALAWLLGGSPLAEFLLDWFEFYVYPCLNPQGVQAGYFRSCPETPAADHNRLWNTSGSNEAVDAFKAAMAADTGGTIEAGIDFHGSIGTLAPYLDSVDHSSALYAAFLAKMQAQNPAFNYLDQSVASMLRALWAGTCSARLAAVVEGTQSTGMSIPGDWKTQGEQVMKSLAQMHADGRWTNGPGVGARAFNGTTDRIDFPAIGDLSAGAFTLSAWVYLDSYPANGYILCLHESGDTQYGIVMNFNDAANRYFNLTIHGAADMVRGSAANGAVSGAWTHYLATWSGGAISDATRAKLYRGGVELSYSTPTNGAGTPAGALGKLSLGGRIYSDTRNFPGKIAQVAVWNRALSAAEIAGLASGLAADRAAAAGLQFYFKGSTAGLAATPGGTGVADGSTHQVGVGAGPSIIY